MYLRLFMFVLSCSASFSVFSQNLAVTEKKANLPTPTLDEISGMIFWNGKLYGHEDSGNDPVIFEIDSTTGAITKTITLSVAYTSTDDWEDITQDETYIYIGNFGNNASGNRTDLKIYRILKEEITAISGEPAIVAANKIEEISFSYEDQPLSCSNNTPCATAANKTQFDCESFIVDNGTIHLFTKDWVSSRTVHYTIPATPGTYVATRMEEFNTDGLLITGATKINDKVVALLGYENPELTLPQLKSPLCKLWLIMGFSDMNTLFSSATNTKEVTLGKYIYSPFPSPQPTEGLGQLESIAAVNATRILIAGERFNRSITSPISASWDVPAQLFGVELGSFIPQEMILPGGIINFVSRTLDNTTVLSWEYSDNGASFFEIQVSATGANSDFKTIGKINAENSPLHTYNFSCNSPSSNKVYYRIKVTTLNYRNLFSKIIVVQKSDEKGFNLKVSPSPFNNQVAISFYNSTSQQMQISVTDVLGHAIVNRHLNASPGNYSLPLDGLDGLSKGVYFLTCRTKDNVFVKKIVKQ